jgi:hypothetical protein
MVGYQVVRTAAPRAIYFNMLAALLVLAASVAGGVTVSRRGW